MRIRLLLAVAALATCLVSSVATAHQTTGTDPVDSKVKCGANVTVLGTGGNDTTFYLDRRDVAGFAPAPVGHDGEYIFSIWLYMESNGHAGLQTKAGDASVIDEEGLENCSTSLTGHTSVTRADTLLW